jgi:hypothetical protein
MTDVDTAYYVVDDERPGFITFDADRAEWYSRHGHRVTAVTGELRTAADLRV